MPDQVAFFEKDSFCCQHYSFIRCQRTGGSADDWAVGASILIGNADGQDVFIGAGKGQVPGDSFCGDMVSVLQCRSASP